MACFVNITPIWPLSEEVLKFHLVKQAFFSKNTTTLELCMFDLFFCLESFIYCYKVEEICSWLELF